MPYIFYSALPVNGRCYWVLHRRATPAYSKMNEQLACVTADSPNVSSIRSGCCPAGSQPETRTMDDGTSLRLRDLEPGDFNKGYIALLQQLTDVGDVDFAAFSAQFSAMDRGSYKTVVIEDTSISKVIASATVFVERKFIHSCGKVGHIEDVVTSSDYRGKRLGHRVVDSCVKWAFAAGCYKVILDCKPELKQFYEKVGFEHRQIQMSIYDLAAP